jgi:hypothetical protein
MKKLVFIFVLGFISNSSFGQNFGFSFINQSENKLLESYSIDYTGPFIRYKVVSNEYKTFKDTALQISFKQAYDRFQNWNSGYFKNIPDTTYFSDGIEYMKDKISDDFLKLTFNETRKILGIYSINVNDESNDIQTIEILELYNTGMHNYIDHVIMIKNFNGYWELFISDETDTSLDCPSCLIP